ncbi:MAG: efflux RND transporter periplasmic adaptor subunit [Sedimentisphaerales bacterium]|nr:efflux RND transporter periplasmic adaptor subunit [Sedimentisphaerales bacterium]MBN2842455.1 efflux RND transporter periplasmic adaptor subunit [Sedimentisphaerales bacterium]
MKMQCRKNRSGKAMLWLMAIIVAFILGVFLAGYFNRQDKGRSDTPGPVSELWYCSMHPQIKQDKPGLCPLCNMDLIVMDQSVVSDLPGEISFNPDAIKLMEVATAPAQRREIEYELRLTGRVKYDEQAQSMLTAWTAGRIERLFVDYTGQQVIKGSPMLELYSPQLNTAVEEYLQAYRAVTDSGSSELVRQSAQANMQLAAAKLEQMGLAHQQIELLPQNNQRAVYVTINAPADGIVTQRYQVQGNYVKAGDNLFSIADLNKLWVVFDVFESDMAKIKLGDEAEFTTPAYAGEVFSGQVSFISPVVDPVSRTIEVRVNYDNSNGELKPDMLVQGQVKVKYGHQSPSRQQPLLIPASSPLMTGKRAIVYVAVPHRERPTYTGREVELGRRWGDYYEVLNGLSEGDQVVVSGNFKIDSSIQLSGGMSMMNMSDPAVPGEQMFCPVMGNPIDKKVFVIYKGQKVYFCCPGCDKKFKEDPEKYLDKLPQFNK